MHSQIYYVGLDVHKRSVSFCVKLADGTVVQDGEVKATRAALAEWAEKLPRPWVGALEATLFSHWIYYWLQNFASEMRMGHPARMKAIASGKKKNDRVDAAMITDLLRCNLFPAIQVLPESYVAMRQVLRYRNLLVRSHVQMENKIAGLLMEAGVEYEKQKLHGGRYFGQLLKNRPEISASVRPLLTFSRSQMETVQRMERQLAGQLSTRPELTDRLQRLTRIPGVGPITALTWVLEVGPIERLATISKAVSYCGLTSAQRSSAGVDKRGPLSKQRNRFLQVGLIEAAKIAPRWNPLLKQLHERELTRGNKNRATLAVARKLVAYLWAADRGHQPAALLRQPTATTAAG